MTTTHPSRAKLAGHLHHQLFNRLLGQAQSQIVNCDDLRRQFNLHPDVVDIGIIQAHLFETLYE